MSVPRTWAASVWCITSHPTKPPTETHPHTKPKTRMHTQGGEKKVLAEVWSATALLKTLQLGHAHGPVMGDAWFGAFTWCVRCLWAVYVMCVTTYLDDAMYSQDRTL